MIPALTWWQVGGIYGLLALLAAVAGKLHTRRMRS